MAEKKSKILNTTSVCIIYMLFGFTFAEAPQPGTVETLLACELYPDVHPVEAELEDLFKGLHSKLEDAEKKVGELLETKKYRIQELEEQIAILEKKRSDSEAESVKNEEKVAELESELEEFRTKANEKEKELTDEKKKLEEALKSSGEKLIEAENLVEVLRIELSTTQENLKSVENDLQAAGLRESEIMEKLKSVEDQLEHVNLKKSELEARIAEVEDQVKLYEDQVREAETRKIELEETNLKLTQELAATVSEKDETFKQLQTSKKLVEDLEQKFQTQIPSSLLEENNLLKEKLKEAEISEKSILQSRVKELEEQLVTVESQLKQEVESVKADFAEKVREGDILKEQLIKRQEELNELKKVIDDGASVFTCFVSAIGKIIF